MKMRIASVLQGFISACLVLLLIFGPVAQAQTKFHANDNGWECTTNPFAYGTVSYQAYIPADHIGGPFPCIEGGNTSLTFNYLGDYSSYSPGYRATQNQFFYLTDLPVGNNLPSTGWSGVTMNFGSASPVLGPNAPLSSPDFDGVPYDCYLWNNLGYATISSPVQAYINAGQQATVLMGGVASDPLEPSIFNVVSVKWGFSLFLDNYSKSTTISGLVTCFPGHRIIEAGSTIWDDPPLFVNTAYLALCLAAPPTVAIVGEVAPLYPDVSY